MRFILAASFACAVAWGLLVRADQPSFIVAAEKSEARSSRNEVKEEIGDSLHRLVKTLAATQSAVGKMLMQCSVLSNVIATQVGALVEDSAPFDSASTKRLLQAQDEMDKELNELRTLLDSLNGLGNRIASTVRLE